MHELALVWFVIIAFCIVMYVILDGFTLGTGLMLPFLKNNERDIAMSVILPTWDGNQTWLVLGIAALYGNFPKAFSLLMPILYLPMLLMGIALLFRGIAFEFRLKSQRAKARWDITFFLASLLVTFIQGIILGNFVEGFELSQQQMLTNFHLIDAFSLFVGLSLLLGYSLLGATRLILKTLDNIREKMIKVAKVTALGLGVFIFIVSVWTPFVNPHIDKKWFDMSLWPYLAVLPAITAIAFLTLLYALEKKQDVIPYWSSVILFLCPYIGFIISVYPYMVPYQLTYWQAAAPNTSLRFLLPGAIVMLPVLLAYTGYAYRIFRGKVTDVLHY